MPDIVLRVDRGGRGIGQHDPRGEGIGPVAQHGDPGLALLPPGAHAQGRGQRADIRRVQRDAVYPVLHPGQRKDDPRRDDGQPHPQQQPDQQLDQRRDHGPGL